VGLVDDELRHVKRRKRIKHALRHQTFRGHIDDLRAPRAHRSPGRDLILPMHAGMDRHGLDANRTERRNLVVHQRNKW